MRASRGAFLATAGLGLFGAALRPVLARAASAPTAVLVHGEFVDATIWRNVLPLLASAGISTVAVHSKLMSAGEDIAKLGDVIEGVRGDVVLVGHSYGGAVISGVPASADNKLRGLVYVAGLAPDENETFEDLLNRFPRLPSARDVVPSGGGLVIARDKFAADYAADILPAQADAIAASQAPLSAGVMSEPAAAPAWKRLRSWYAVSSADCLLPPAAQTFFAARMHAETITIPASHASPLSHPAEVASLIVRAAKPGTR